MRNWKTTGLGVCALLTAVGTAGTALLDGDPETQPDIVSLLAGIVGVVAILTREEGQHRRDALGKLLLGTVCLAPLLLIGCVSPLADRGSLGETTAAIDMDWNFGIAPGTAPAIQIDSTSTWYLPLVAAIADANADGTVTPEEAANIAKLAGSLGQVVYVHNGDIVVTVSGEQKADTSGTTTQTATGPQTEGSLPVSLTGGGAP